MIGASAAANGPLLISESLAKLGDIFLTDYEENH
jgi:hypothetical protein